MAINFCSKKRKKKKKRYVYKDLGFCHCPIYTVFSFDYWVWRQSTFQVYARKGFLWIKRIVCLIQGLIFSFSFFFFLSDLEIWETLDPKKSFNHERRIVGPSFLFSFYASIILLFIISILNIFFIIWFSYLFLAIICSCFWKSATPNLARSQELRWFSFTLSLNF